MKVNVLGTSCTWFKRNNTSYIIDERIVLDVPAGNYKHIVRNMDIYDINSILISHFHSDHFEDLRYIVTRVMRHDGVVRGRLKVYGPKGILDKIIELNKVLCSRNDEIDKEKLTKDIDFIELYDGFEFEAYGYKIKAYQMNHGIPETFGFKFTDVTGQVVAFTTDTAMCENVHKLLESSNFAFVEMSDVNPNKTHLCVDEFMELSKKYSSTKMFPVHTSDRAQEFAINNGLNYLNDGDILDL